MSLLTTQVESLLTKLEENNWIMKSVSMVGVKKMAPNIGLLETLGEATGVKEEMLESSEELIT